MIGPFSKKWSAFAQLRKQTHNSVIEQIAKGQKMTKTKRYDLPSYTEGWFQIGWSQQLPVGAIKKVEQFGKTYVLFRGEDGQVGLVDDVCPHLGSRFSAGGCVKKNAVRCPYHHWSFDRTGQCTDIPYAKKIPPKAKVAAHAVVERYGMIFMYRNKAGASPTYDLPQISDFDPNHYGQPHTYEFRIRIHGQDIMENSVDSPHFAAVHGHNMPENRFQHDGRSLRITQMTSLKRFGTTLKGRLEFHMIEPGFHYCHFPEMPMTPALVFSSIVPVDGEFTNHRLTLWTKKTRVPFLSGLAGLFVRWQMMKTYHEDMEIWESKEYLTQPILCDGDGAIMKLRRWYSQFYDDASPSSVQAPLQAS